MHYQSLKSLHEIYQTLKSLYIGTGHSSGTCPMNSLHKAFCGTSCRDLRQKHLVHTTFGTCPRDLLQGLVTGTSPLVCKGKVCLRTNCGPSGRNLSQFLQHEASTSISTPPWMGCQSIAGLPPSIKFASTHLYTWVERSTKRVKCLVQEQGLNTDRSLRS